MKKTFQLLLCLLPIFSQTNCSNAIERSPKELIIGTWEGIIENDKITWTVSPNGTEEYDWYHAEGIQHGSGKWSVENDILYEQFKQSKTVCKLEFEGIDHLILTVLDNGNPENRGQKRDYYRKKDENKLGIFANKNASNEAQNSSDRIKNNNSIVGIWKNHEITENYGIKSWMTIIWEFKPNNKSVLRVRTENGYKNGNNTTWKMSGETLQTTSDGKTFEKYKVIWDDENFLGFTLKTEGSLNNRHFTKISTNPFANDDNTDPEEDNNGSNKKNRVVAQ